MSAPTTHDPLVVNTRDGAVWQRRAVMADGRGLYAVAGACACPEYLMATLSELAEHGIVGSADALPVPVGAEPKVTAERLAEIKDLIRYESSIAFYSHRAKESVLLLVAEAEEAARLRARVAELEAAPKAVYRAAHDLIPMGLYTTAAEARAHCVAEERSAWAKDAVPVLDWIEDEEDGVAELVTVNEDGEADTVTGYVVTALEIASAYDEEADQ